MLRCYLNACESSVFGLSYTLSLQLWTHSCTFRLKSSTSCSYLQRFEVVTSYTSTTMNFWQITKFKRFECWCKKTVHCISVHRKRGLLWFTTEPTNEQYTLIQTSVWYLQNCGFWVEWTSCVNLIKHSSSIQQDVPYVIHVTSAIVLDKTVAFLMLWIQFM